MFSKLSRTWRKPTSPQISIPADREALTTSRCKQSIYLNFNFLKFPIFWIALFYNSAAYAAPKAALPSSPIKPQTEDESFSGKVKDYLQLSPVANSADKQSVTPLMSQVAPPEVIDPSTVEAPERIETLETDELTSEENPETESAETSDSELGILRLREQELQQLPPTDSAETDDLTNVPTTGQTSNQTEDPELGILRLREEELEQIETQLDSTSTETVFFIGRLSSFKSDNILLDRIDPVDDELISLSATVLAAPRLGPDTLLITSVEGGLVHYNELSGLDYRELEFRASLRQFFSARTYGEIGWSNQQLFDDGDRFFNDHSLRLSLSRRDPLTSDLRLDSFYQLRLSFADPSDRNRIINTLGVGLNYNLQPDLSVGLDYQLTLTDFTQQDRDDLYNQVVAQLSYDLSRNSRFILFGGFSFGDSSDSDVDFNSTIFGASIDVNVPLF